MTKINCDIIQDLLPLYHDQICSESSSQMVVEHLETCEVCRKMSFQLQDHSMEQTMLTDAKVVFETHQKKTRRTAATAGMIMSGILLIPTVICLICNLAIGGGLDWFFNVFTALLVAASVSVVPLFSLTHKASRAVMCMTGSLVLLYLAASLYTGGHWFFTATAGTVFGISTVAVPLILKDYDHEKLRGKHGLISVAWDTIWFLLLVFAGMWIGGDHAMIGGVMKVILCFVPAAWVVFLVWRHLPVLRSTKAAITVVIVGVMLAFANDLIAGCFGYGWVCFLKYVHLNDWSGNVNSNVYMCFLIGSVVVGAVVWLLGKLIHMRKERRGA